MTRESLATYEFQYTTQNMENERKWIELDEFKSKVAWKMHGIKDGVAWEGKLSSELLYQIAKDFGSSVFIGIQGGENALRRMDGEEIRNRSWSISMTKSTSQWLDGKLFYDILCQK